jgi:outer membrane protein assembly factor BamE (lipoprotein component of BamABCDE complex)
LVIKRRIFKLSTLFLGASLLALSLSACESRKNTRGNLLDPERVEDIRPGELNRDEVVEILGSPSSITPFGSDTWYYISQRTESYAFFAPKVLERQIVVVSFDKKGKVTKVDTVGLEQGREIIPVARKTPTHGNKLTVLEQLIGNLGRFKNANKNAAKKEDQ